jgi:hypothetical protein
MSVGGFVLFGAILLVATLMTDLVVGKLWRTRRALRQILQTMVLGCGLWWMGAHNIARNSGHAEPDWVQALIITVPSVAMSTIALLIIANTRKRELPNPADDF